MRIYSTTKLIISIILIASLYGCNEKAHHESHTKVQQEDIHNPEIQNSQNHFDIRSLQKKPSPIKNEYKQEPTARFPFPHIPETDIPPKEEK